MLSVYGKTGKQPGKAVTGGRVSTIRLIDDRTGPGTLTNATDYPCAAGETSMPKPDI